MRLLTPTRLALTIAHAAADEGTGQPGPVAEIVTFRLIDGTNTADFLTAAKDMGPFLRGTGAMIRRTLSEDHSGLWTDHIIWTSLAAAQAAAAQMFERPEAQPFLAMINSDGVAMRHAPVHLQQE
ncbi:MAG: hypothetical protein AAGF36_07135 [Pseudomonadota bacterium]